MKLNNDYITLLSFLFVFSFGNNSLAHEPEKSPDYVYSFCYDVSDEGFVEPKFIPLSRIILSTKRIELPKELDVFYVPLEENRRKKSAHVHRSLQPEYVLPKFGWVDGIIEGSSVVIFHIPYSFQFDPYPETRPLGERLEGFEGYLPKKCKVFAELTKIRALVRTPAVSIERIVPNIHKDGKTYMMIEPARVVKANKPNIIDITEPYPFEVHDKEGNTISSHRTLQELRKIYKLYIVEGPTQ